eukprot:scaffold4247_cov66-Cylindrotheca_fusiformis.AAC.21
MTAKGRWDVKESKKKSPGLPNRTSSVDISPVAKNVSSKSCGRAQDIPKWESAMRSTKAAFPKARPFDFRQGNTEEFELAHEQQLKWLERLKSKNKLDLSNSRRRQVLIRQRKCTEERCAWIARYKAFKRNNSNHTPASSSSSVKSAIKKAGKRRSPNGPQIAKSTVHQIPRLSRAV